MTRFRFSLLLLCLLLALGSIPAQAAPANPEKAVAEVLDALHLAASKADGKAYFALFAPDAVFFGTDKTERWPLKEFQPYGQKRFDTGKGWTYKPTERHVFFSGDGKTAWFDERLAHSAGEARGTGVLVHDGKAWKIVQYNLSFPVPNDLFDPIYAIIKTYEEKK